MTGLEPVLKYAPIIGGILFIAMSYGQLQADLKNLQQQQAAQFALIEQQLQVIDGKIK